MFFNKTFYQVMASSHAQKVVESYKLAITFCYLINDAICQFSLYRKCKYLIRGVIMFRYFYKSELRIDLGLGYYQSFSNRVLNIIQLTNKMRLLFVSF